MIQCEFCDELQAVPNGRFNAVYDGLADSRIVIDTGNFVVMPTLGQLFQGSMLILPRRHIETSARLAPELRSELADLLDHVVEIIRQCGYPVYFEHGASSCTGGACGIYHAHIHVVPLPEPVPADAFLPHTAVAATTLGEALDSLADSEHYLLFGNGPDVRYCDVAAFDVAPPSQYFRRALAERFAVNRPWNWRDFSTPEPDLLQSLVLFGGDDAVGRRTY